MTFSESVKTCLTTKYACFSGRASRSEYWWFQLFFAIIDFIGFVIGVSLITDPVEVLDTMFDGGQIVDGIIGLLVLIPMWSVLFRRLHDIGKSGWNCLWHLLPLIGSIVLLIFMLRKGDENENKYGPVPGTIGYEKIG